jgi:hypothetical protein
MNLGQFMQYIEIKAGKDTFGGFITPTNFTQIANWAQLENLNAYVRNFEATGELSDDLFPFTIVMGDNTELPLTVSTYGYADKPSDYWYRTRFGYNRYVTVDGVSTRQYRGGEFVSQAVFDYRMSTELMAPDLDEPIAVIQNDKILFRPQGMAKIVFGYIRRPSDVYFDYDIVNDEVVYLPPGDTHVNSSVEPIGSESLSVEFEWPESAHNALAERMLKYYAIMYRGDFNVQLLDITKPA